MDTMAVTTVNDSARVAAAYIDSLPDNEIGDWRFLADAMPRPQGPNPLWWHIVQWAIPIDDWPDEPNEWQAES